MSFRYKDYRRNGRARFRTMSLVPDEFIRRFLLHVLPKGFHRIRHYGLLVNPGAAYRMSQSVPAARGKVWKGGIFSHTPHRQPSAAERSNRKFAPRCAAPLLAAGELHI